MKQHKVSDEVRNLMGKAKEAVVDSRSHCEAMAKRTDTDVACTRLVELRPGEVPVSREALAKAWDTMPRDEVAEGFRANHTNSRTFKALCKALGLPATQKEKK